MVEETKLTKKEVIINASVLIFVVVAGSFFAIRDYRSREEFRQAGKRFCAERGYEYAYASGDKIHCYTQDEEGVRTAYDFWVDKQVCINMYGDKQ